MVSVTKAIPAPSTLGKAGVAVFVVVFTVAFFAVVFFVVSWALEKVNANSAIDSVIIFFIVSVV